VLAAPPGIPECLESFAHRLRFIKAIKRVGYDPRTSSVFTIVEAGPLDTDITNQVFEAEEQCLQQWPEDLPLIHFELINLGDFPAERHAQLVQQYRGALPLLP